MWNIVKTVKCGRYVYAVVPDHPNRSSHNYVLLHRVLMENGLGRLLTSDEVVHHKDFNRYNNDLSNLQVMTRIEHIHLHADIKRHMIDLVCANCGKIFARPYRNRPEAKGYKHAFCTSHCNAVFYGNLAHLGIILS